MTSLSRASLRTPTLRLALACLAMALGASAHAQNWISEGNQVGARHGAALAASGDVNGDGRADVLIGQPDWDSLGSTNNGRVVLFLGTASGVAANASWSYSFVGSNAALGSCVAHIGDVNGDGFGDVAVGAPGYSNGQASEGRVLVFLGSASGLNAGPSNSYEANQAGADYGRAIARLGDVNGDGFDDFAASAPSSDTTLTDAGRVYVYHGSASGLPAGPSTVVAGNVTGMKFGGAIAGGADFNADGFDDLVVGAETWSVANLNAGLVQVFHGSSAGISTTAAWQRQGASTDTGLGCSVAALEDVNGDGFGDVLLGSRGVTFQGNNGGAHLYLGGITGINSALYRFFATTQVGNAFAQSVASAGYVNDDNYSDFVVGAPLHDNGQTDEGRAFVFLGGPTLASISSGPTYESNQAGAQLGVAVCAGDVQRDGAGDVLLGAPLFDQPQASEGAVFGFYGTPSAPKTRYVSGAATAPGQGTIASPYRSVQYAIAHPTTKAGDTVLIDAGTYNERLDTLGKAIVVAGSGAPGAVTINAGNLGSALRIRRGESQQTVIRDLRFIGGRGNVASLLGVGAGGGLLVENSSPRVLNCSFDSNGGVHGGGIAVLGGAPFFQNCVVRNNSAFGSVTPGLDGIGGGIYVRNGSGTVVFEGCTIELNVSRLCGGGAYVRDAVVEFRGGSFFTNGTTLPSFDLAGNKGGALFTEGSGSTLVEDMLLEGNSVLGGALPEGGAVVALHATTLRRCDIRNNFAGDAIVPGIGGGVSGGTLEDCQLVANVADLAGGGATGNASLLRCRVSLNRSQTGAGISECSAAECLIDGNLGSGTGSVEVGGGAAVSSLTNCIVRSNAVNGFGGGTYNCFLSSCIVENNTATAADANGAQGGGVYDGTATNCVLRGNDAVGVGYDPAFGGGACLATLVGCELFDNVALGDSTPSEGGGARSCTLVKCVLAGNAADHGAGASASSLDRCTLVDNVAGISGGGTFDCTTSSSILWANQPQALAGGSTTYSNVQGQAGVDPTNISAAPLFWIPAERDYHLRAGSPSIDTGALTAPLDPDGSRADQGAFPYDPAYCPAPAVYCTAKVNSQGCLPSIGFTGSATLGGADDFVIRAINVLNQKSGLCFWGSASSAVPFQGGTKCVAPPTVRAPISNSGGNVGPDDCSGEYVFPLTHAYMTANGMGVGATFYAQWWTRDPGSLSNTGLSDGLRFTICP